MKLKISYSLLLASMLLSLWACSGKKKHTANDGISIAYPEHLEVYDPSSGRSDSTLPGSGKERLKIYTLVNASCTSCVLKLEQWDDFRSQLKNPDDVSIIPVCFSRDNFELLKFAFENNKIRKTRLRLVLDREQNGFRKQNEILMSKHGDFTALTDADNHVLLLGNPMDDESDKSKFMTAIKMAN